ncbi:hypothetical protein QUH38_26490, partial [Klebsiella pneumoniae]|nr:hypothetical protein [Klebsiella pneumoniae]
QGLRSCACCTAVLPVDQTVCPRCNSKGTARRKNSLQWTLALLRRAIAANRDEDIEVLRNSVQFGLASLQQYVEDPQEVYFV